MTTTPDADPPRADDSDPDEHNPGPGIDDTQLPEDLRPTDDNPLAQSPDESSDSAGVAADDVSSHSAGQSGGQIGDVAQSAGEAPD